MIRDEKACLRWRKYSRGLEALGLFQKSYTDVTGCTHWLSCYKRSVCYIYVISIVARICSIAPPSGCYTELPVWGLLRYSPTLRY